MKRRGACPECGQEMLSNSLWRHCNKVHGKSLSEVTSAGSAGGRLPVEPILRHLRLLGGDIVGTCLATAGYHKGTAVRASLDKKLERAITDGHLTIAAADAICCRVLGLHPYLVYGETWWADVADWTDELEVAS